MVFKSVPTPMFEVSDSSNISAGDKNDAESDFNFCLKKENEIDENKHRF